MYCEREPAGGVQLPEERPDSRDLKGALGHPRHCDAFLVGDQDPIQGAQRSQPGDPCATMGDPGLPDSTAPSAVRR